MDARKREKEKRSEHEAARERTKARVVRKIPDKETDKEADVQSECKCRYRRITNNHWKHKVCPSGDYYFRVKPNSKGSTAKESNNDGVRCNACYKPRGKAYDVPMRVLKHKKARKARVRNTAHWGMCHAYGRISQESCALQCKTTRDMIEVEYS
ncbi:hypothetical protein DFJ58DRAFT_845961 [Suillus subalutaceus]|uniref:uncharacterized protein n=1 Tax=Suillus subalutaceus TaxID=48586 RepID=UPI001B85FCDE|nr:uncharacterized protein DFJ58DRAFT_845961 [Suillus subalutaceus]KAG1838730.1 hypothetical protein DFJ58DRAFT_845961 [Suillus subalutaceus]